MPRIWFRIILLTSFLLGMISSRSVLASFIRHQIYPYVCTDWSQVALCG